MPNWDKIEESRARAKNPETRNPTPNELAREEARYYLQQARDFAEKRHPIEATAAATVALAIMAVEIVN